MEEMEKYIDRDNQKVEYDTGPIVWGKSGNKWATRVFPTTASRN